MIYMNLFTCMSHLPVQNIHLHCNSICCIQMRTTWDWNTHTNTLAYTHSHNYTHTHTHKHTCTHEHTHAHAHALSLIQNADHILPQSLHQKVDEHWGHSVHLSSSHLRHWFQHTWSKSNTHIHTHTHTHTHKLQNKNLSKQEKQTLYDTYSASLQDFLAIISLT